jgi:hypothetical protein
MTGIGADPLHEDVNGNVTLTSPMFDLSGYSDPWLNFWLWYVDVHPLMKGDDSLHVLLSNDGGRSWRTALRVDSTIGNWRAYHLRVSDIVAPTSSMLFRIIALDNGRPTLLRAGLDDFSVTDGIGAGVDDPGVVSGGVAVRVSPNPASASVAMTIRLDRPAAQTLLELYDAMGQRVAVVREGAMDAGMNQVVIDVNGLPAGRYTWRLRVDKRKITSGGIVVVR